MSYKRSKSDCSEGGGRGGGRVWEGERLVNFLALNKSHDNSIYDVATPLIYILHEARNYKVLLDRLLLNK